MSEAQQRWVAKLLLCVKILAAGLGNLLPASCQMANVFQQEPVERSEASAAPEQLALRSLPAVDHDAVAPGLH